MASLLVEALIVDSVSLRPAGAESLRVTNHLYREFSVEGFGTCITPISTPPVGLRVGLCGIPLNDGLTNSNFWRHVDSENNGPVCLASANATGTP